MDLKERLEGLLAQDPGHVELSAQRTFEDLSRDHPLVFFGAGGLGRRIVEALGPSSPPISCFSDNNPALWHQDVRGLTVLPPEEAVSRFGRDALFVVTIWSAARTSKVQSALNQLRTLGCQFVTTFVPLFWSLPQQFLPYFAIDLPEKVLGARAQVLEAFDLFEDERSRQEYVRQVEWRLTGDFSCLGPPIDGPQYFPPEFAASSKGDLFVDCGAFDGDTVRHVMVDPGLNFDRVLALEPDPVNFSRLQAFVSSLPGEKKGRIELMQAAVADVPGEIRFRSTGTGSSCFDPGGDVAVRAVPLDEIVSGGGRTFLKFDVEGAEDVALRGAASLIESSSPFLAVSVYHRQEHLWELPRLIARLQGRYRQTLRPHNSDGFDLVCYAFVDEAGGFMTSPHGGTSERVEDPVEERDDQ